MKVRVGAEVLTDLGGPLADVQRALSGHALYAEGEDIQITSVQVNGVGFKEGGVSAAAHGNGIEVVSCNPVDGCALGADGYVPGMGSIPAKIMFVGQAPNKNSLDCGRPFVSESLSGKELRRGLEYLGIEEEQVYISNAVKCLAAIRRRGGDADRVKLEQSQACEKWLRWEIETVQPKLIVALGSDATRAMYNGCWLQRFRDQYGDHQVINGIIHFPMEHPSHWARNRVRTQGKEEFPKNMVLLREKIKELHSGEYLS